MGKSRTRKEREWMGGGILLLTALIWGVAFVAQSVANGTVGPFIFVFSRFVIAGIALLPFSLYSIRKERKEQLQNSQRVLPAPGNSIAALWKAGFVCGFFLGIGSAIQQLGMLSSSVGKAGFITALYVILVPILGIFLGRKADAKIWGCALIALQGLYLIAIKSGTSLGLSEGDRLLLIGSFVFSVQILAVGYYGPRHNVIVLSNLQFLTAGLVGLAGMLYFERSSFSLQGLQAAAVPILYTGILSSAAGFTFQVIGQRDTNPAVASILMSMESVFSALAGFFLLHQRLSRRELYGSALVFTAVILAKIPIEAFLFRQKKQFGEAIIRCFLSTVRVRKEAVRKEK